MFVKFRKTDPIAITVSFKFICTASEVAGIDAILIQLFYVQCRDSVVCIATDYWLDDPGVRVLVPVGSRIFSSPCCLTPALGSTQPSIQWVPGALSPVVKQPARESDHSPRTSADIKKMWIYTSTPPYAFTA
jgi:hypothetical protein